jgi:hypothetical protein
VNLRFHHASIFRGSVLSMGILLAGTETGAACRPSPQPGPGTGNHFMADTITLSASRPRAQLPLSSLDLQPNADVLTFSVLSVNNPRKLPIGIAVGVGNDAGGAKTEFTEIGRVALYPPDQPARFALRVPRSVQDMLARTSGKSSSLVIELVRDSADSNARQVTIGKIAWSKSLDSEPRGGP